MEKVKGYIQLEGRWYHVTLIEAVEQLNLQGEVEVIFAFKRSKKSREVEFAPKERFHKKKPKPEDKSKKDKEN